MARPTLYTHRKMLRLARRIGSFPLALGHLELLWASANETGEPAVGDAEDVEAVAQWAGEDGELATALVDSGFLDRSEDGQLEIHDFWDHAPDYVRKRRQRELERKEKGARLRSASRQRPGGDRSVSRPATGQRLDSDQPLGTPPAPAPAPAPKEPPTVPQRGTREAAFDRWYAEYPRKKGKRKAWLKWQQLDKAGELPEVAALLDALARQKVSHDWTKDGGEFIPHPATYLHQGRWEDEASSPSPRDRLAGSRSRQASRGRAHWQPEDMARAAEKIVVNDGTAGEIP